MSNAPEPIGTHEGVELAEATGYYLRRNADARNLLAQSDEFPSLDDSSGKTLMHYETMVIRAAEPAPDSGPEEKRVLLYPALAINGADATHEMAPVLVTLLTETEVRGGFIALLQRMNDSDTIGMVYFFSDDHTSSYQSAA